tara:strand:- start:5 stop:2218 length:2214 start_codon:yes stop_codon:yes gene_type:complete
MTGAELEKEKKEILNYYRSLLRVARLSKSKEDRADIRKAFNVALDAHINMRRKSGEPYIYHPLAVAKIATEEIGLGTTAIVCALLHDTVEDTEITLEDITRLFNPKVSKIIDGLTKISGVYFDPSKSIQAENFRKMLLTLSDDVRVILIKLADRLHNMRTLGSMRRDKQLKIASETLYLYAPLAHRLGLYNIKTELEDLCLKYTHPEEYEFISTKLKKTQAVRTRFISRFIHPIKTELAKQNFKLNIKGRPKSIYSIWNKMETKGVPFEEVYDIFAIRIILDSGSENEKADSWKVYSIVTDFYRPNPDRLRDWISIPKANGYESLHTTVMSPSGKWVEVQIRSNRMNEIAEKGFAAHWRYKTNQSDAGNLDLWIERISEMLENPNPDALDFMDDFKMNLFSDEIFVFTPKGELKTLPTNATSLDFAYEIHSQVGSNCIGAKVNYKLVPLSHQLKSGDQVEIITSKKQKPKEDWLKFVLTGKAKSSIKSALKEDKKKVASLGKGILERKLSSLNFHVNQHNLMKLFTFYKLKSELDLMYNIGLKKIDLSQIKKLKREGPNIIYHPRKKPTKGKEKKEITTSSGKVGLQILGGDFHGVDYKLSSCCNPIPGDDVFGFITKHEGLKIHRTKCPNAIEMMSNFAYRIVQAKWTNSESIAFLVGIHFKGIDRLGIINNITKIISAELNVNMRSISFDTDDGIFEGKIMAFVNDTSHLDSLVKKLKKVDGVLAVSRIDTSSLP